VYATVLVVAILLTILMSNQFAEILGDAAANTVAKDAVFEVLRLTFLRYLTFLMPVSLLLGIMLALARLNRDSEMAALGASGIGPARLLIPVGTLTLVLAVFTSWLVFDRMPAAERRIEEIRQAARDTTDLAGIEPGRFTTFDSGRTVLYAREVEGNRLTDVFIQGERDGRVFVVTAKRGERVEGNDGGLPTFLLYDGRRVEGVPGEAEFLVATFGEHGSPIPIGGTEEPKTSPASLPTSTLLRSAARPDRAELMGRLSTPLSLIVLALLAVPLSRSSPREGRYARIGIGLLIYVIYVEGLSIARVSFERNTVPEWLGMWWVHALLGFVAITVLLKQSGAFARPQPFAYDSRTGHEPTA
jgi:lipopolysaccharide export system permease protein